MHIAFETVEINIVNESYIISVHTGAGDYFLSVIIKEKIIRYWLAVIMLYREEIQLATDAVKYYSRLLYQENKFFLTLTEHLAFLVNLNFPKQESFIKSEILKNLVFITCVCLVYFICLIVTHKTHVQRDSFF